MKNIYLILAAILIGVSIVGCKKKISDSLPVEDLKALPGRYRAQVVFIAHDDAKSGKVFYDKGNFQEFQVNDTSPEQTIIVDSLPEKEQWLRIVTVNSDGRVSDPRGVLVNVYGDKYESELKPRRLTNQTFYSSTSLQVDFEQAFTDETGVWVVFSNTSGTKDSVFMNNIENSIKVDEVDTTKPYFFYSVYKPSTESIDEFFSTSVDLKTAFIMNFQKEKWIIDAFSSNATGTETNNIIDDDGNTSWGSKVGQSPTHWFTIDMESQKRIDGFYYLSKPDNNNALGSIKIEVSNDNNTWTKVFEDEIEQSYMRQRIQLSQTITVRYFKITLKPQIDNSDQMSLSEIDAYNSLGASGINGYTEGTPVTLTNSEAPFEGDGSNLFPILGDYRMQKVKGWTHNSSAVVSFDKAKDGGSFSVFIAPVWGLGKVTNGKIHQSVNLEPGDYILRIEAGNANRTNFVDMYGVVVSGESLPDYSSVLSSTNTLKFVDLVANQNKTSRLLFTVDQSSQVSVGIVYNLVSQYSTTGTPWTSFLLKGFELLKVE